MFLYLICLVKLLGCHLKKGEQSLSSCGLSWQTQQAALRLSQAHVQPIPPSFSPHGVLYKQVPSCHSPSGKEYHNCTNQNSPCLASQRRNTRLIISSCQSSSASAHLSHTWSLYHDHWLCCDTAGPVTSFNIQVLWRGGTRGCKADRSGRENSLFRPFCGLFQRPPCTFHLSACEIEPLPVLHIYCDPIMLPHIQPSDEGCCSSSAILKRKKKKCYNLPPYMHTHTRLHTSCTFLFAHKHAHLHTHSLTFLYFVPGLIVHAR